MLTVEARPKSIEAEAYKILRTNINYSTYDKQILIVTSSKPQEGKSITVGNLGISLADDGKKVLIIDCDLRRPSIHKKFEISNLEGLTEVLLGTVELDKGIKNYKNHIDILTSGKLPPNPAEILGSNMMSELLAELRMQYDCILIDTPPILAVTDAQILAAKSDGVIFVVGSGSIKKKQVLQAKNNLDKVGANIVGIVLNSVNIKGLHEDCYYYYGTNKYEDQYEVKRKKRFWR